MESLYYFPPASKSGYSNPYSIYYKKELEQYFNVLDKNNKPTRVLSWNFLKNAFIADIFILNWIENAPYFRFGYIQYLLVCIGLKIIKWRNKKIIWMFHNIHPHQGDNKFSKRIQNKLYNQSTIIISHSKEAAEYARRKTNNIVIYKCHPLSSFNLETFNGKVDSCDVLIWGSILPYKGIYEFISDFNIQKSNLRIRIIGRCTDDELCKKIDSQCNERITFENRRIEFNELKACISKSNYVLFPYIGDCVSSSGALIDTIALGGTPIGPYIGAFKDLKEENVCFTYKQKEDLLTILSLKTKLNSEHVNDFISKNSWSCFIKDIIKII